MCWFLLRAKLIQYETKEENMSETAKEVNKKHRWECIWGKTRTGGEYDIACIAFIVNMKIRIFKILKIILYTPVPCRSVFISILVIFFICSYLCAFFPTFSSVWKSPQQWKTPIVIRAPCVEYVLQFFFVRLLTRCLFTTMKTMIQVIGRHMKFDQIKSNVWLHFLLWSVLVLVGVFFSALNEIKFNNMSDRIKWCACDRAMLKDSRKSYLLCMLVSFCAISRHIFEWWTTMTRCKIATNSVTLQIKCWDEWHNNESTRMISSSLGYLNCFY